MFNNVYKGKKVIVTGHTGFKGSWLSLWLKYLGAEVYGISNEVYQYPSSYEVVNLESQIQSHLTDIRDFDNIKLLFENISPDFVFHLAAQPIVKKAYDLPLDTFHTNIIGTANILEALRNLNNNCIAVMITSDKCYDNVEWVWGYKETDHIGGKDPYSASKGAAELVIKTYFHSYFKNSSNIKISSVRAGNVIGGGDWAENRIVPDCYRAWSKNKKVVIRSPNATRPWQHVLEPLSGYLRTGELLMSKTQSKLINGEAFNFGPPADHNYTVLDLIQELSNDWGGNRKENIEVERSNFYESGLLKLNCDKALYFMNWKPVLNFAETAKFTSSWYEEYYKNSGSDMLLFSNDQIKEYTELAKKNDLEWSKN